MTKLLLCAVVLAMSGCASAPMSSIPPSDRKQDVAKTPAPAPKVEAPITMETPLDIPLSAVWTTVPIDDPSVGLAWVRDGGVLTMQRYPFAEIDPDTVLEKILGELHRGKAKTDDTKWYPQSVVIRWTEDSTRGFVCARTFPKPDGPLTIVFIGAWPEANDAVMAADVVRACNELTVQKQTK